MAYGRRRKRGYKLGSEGDDAALRKQERSVALYGMDEGHRIPHLLSRVAVIIHINLLDGMNVGPIDVAEYTCHDIEGFHLLTHQFHTR